MGSRRTTILICAAGAGLSVWMACNLLLPGAWRGRNDFLGFYAGATLVGAPNLYDRESVRGVQLRAAGESGEVQYGRLPCYALFLKPLSWLPYDTAAAVWEILLAAVFAGFVSLWPGVAASTRWRICCWSLPAFACIFNGQDDVILLLWMAISARLLRAGWAGAAGAVLTLIASKFHLFLFVPLVILAQRRWRMAAGGAAGMGVLLAISFLAAGVGWPWQFYEVLRDSRISTALDHMPNLHSLLTGTGALGLPLQTIAALALAAGVFLSARQAKSFEAALGVALAAGVLVGFHGYLHDGSLLLPALMAFSSVAERFARIPAMVLITPVPWFLLQLSRPLPAVTQLLIVWLAVAGMVYLRRNRRPEPKLI